MQDDIEIRFGIYTYPCDTAELDEVIALIGDLDQYVDNAEKDILITRLNEQGGVQETAAEEPADGRQLYSPAPGGV